MPAPAERALIERGEVLAALLGHADGVATGTGRLVFVGGEAGVGKTTLVDALISRVGVRVRTGACDSVTTPAPFGPLSEALPELADRLEDDTVSRLRRFRALRAELAATPTVLVLEDVHWADEPPSTRCATSGGAWPTSRCSSWRRTGARRPSAPTRSSCCAAISRPCRRSAS